MWKKRFAHCGVAAFEWPQEHRISRREPKGLFGLEFATPCAILWEEHLCLL